MKKEILQDIKNGKKQPWKPKKIRSLILADSYQRLGYEKKASRVRFCGSTLAFLLNLETGKKTLKDANFCKERLCPMCQWRKSIKMFHQVSKVMDLTEKRHEDLVPVFLTLTLKNCTEQELSNMLDNIFQGWYQFTKHRKIYRIVQGWFRALEITYNKQDDTYHPHLHIVIMVSQSYFKGKDYMETHEWVRMWQTALKLDYSPICDIRRVKTNKGKHKIVAEVAKYTMKDTTYILDGNAKRDKLVDVLSKALHKRRLTAFGGVLKKIAKELKSEDIDQADLVHIDEEIMREDVATVLEVYRWNFGFANYVKE